MTWTGRHATTAATRSWYLTAATAAVVAALLLATGRTSPAINVGGLLTAVAAVTALIEGYRRHRGGSPSVLAVRLLGGCTIGAGLACLIGVLTTGRPA